MSISDKENVISTPLKRFVVFGGYVNHLHGGFNDLIGCEDHLEIAEVLVSKISVNVDGQFPLHDDGWWHIVDMSSGEIIKSSHPGLTDIDFFNRLNKKYKDGQLVSL